MTCLKLTLFMSLLAALLAFTLVDLCNPAALLAGPGAGFVKLDLLPEHLDPYDLYFNFTFIRYMRPGEPLEIPRSRFNELYAEGAGKPPAGIKSVKITIRKKDGGEGERTGWFSFFDSFYNGRTISCEYDKKGDLLSALMLDGSGEVCIRASNSYDAEGRLTSETSEVFDRVFGHDGSGSADDRRPRTGKTVFRREMRHIYSPKGLLTKSIYKGLKNEGWFEHSCDQAGRLTVTKCYLKELERLYYKLEYSYTGSGRLAGVKWYNGSTGDLEMYYEYAYDEKGNCVSIKNPVFPQPDREDGKLEQKFEYDAQNRLVRGVYYNWFRFDPAARPDSVISCSYGEKGLLSEIEVEPAKMNPGKKYSIKYSYSFYGD